MTASLELTIETLDAQGYGLAATEAGVPVRVWGATIDDRVEVEIVHRSPHRWVGRLIAVLASRNRQPKPCPHRPSCGGCAQWEATDECLAQWRQSVVEEALPWLQTRCLPSPGRGPWRTRSKWQVERRDGAIQLTVPLPRSQHGLPIPECPITPPATRLRLEALTRQLRAEPLASVHAVILTEGAQAGDYAAFGIGLVSASPLPAQRPPAGSSGDAVAWLQQPVRSPQLFRGTSSHYSGPLAVGIPHDGGWLPTPPFAFVQAHPAGREQLLNAALDAVKHLQPGLAVDLGSGTGFFARALAKRGWKVEAVEASPHVAAAWSEPVERVQFVASRAQDYGWPASVDLAIVDPPRSGMDRAWSEPLVAAQPKLIITIHCGRAAAQRDLAGLKETNYSIRSATWIDLFPGSHHGELLSIWERT